MRRDPDQERGRVEEIIYQKFPQVAELLVTDPERAKLRVVLQCPKGHPIETVVLAADHNLHLFLRSLVEYESDTDTEMTENAVAALLDYVGRFGDPCGCQPEGPHDLRTARGE